MAPWSPGRRERVLPPAPPGIGQPLAPAPIPPAATTPRTPRADADRDRRRRADAHERSLPYVDIAPPPTDFAATGSAGAPSGGGAGTATGLLVTLILLTLIGPTLRERVAERRLSPVL